MFFSQFPLLGLIKLIPALILILTKKNSIFRAFILFFFGLTIFILPTVDALLFLVAGSYMFFSAILRKFGVKHNAAISFIIAIILCSYLLYKFIIERRQAFISESNLTITQEINERISLKLSSNKTEEGISTKFYPGQTIYPIEKGLEKDMIYACRVINKNGEIIIPLDKWPIFKPKREVEQKGEFNKGENGYLLLPLGEYIIQLVKIEKNERRAVIVAESNFSIIPYDLSKVVAYLTSENDPGQKFYDSYIVKTYKFGVRTWVQAPKGMSVSGKVKFFKTNYDGVIEKSPWNGETSFTTGSEGEPFQVSGMGGRIPPGIYHFQIIINDEIFRDLKLIIE